MLSRFVDKDIYDECRVLAKEQPEGNSRTWELSVMATNLQLSRDIKSLILAIRSLKAELDGEYGS